jgi:hypothetical protein
MQLVIILVIAGVILGPIVECARRARIGQAMERSFEAMRPPATLSVPAFSTAGLRRATAPRPSNQWERPEPRSVARAS